MRQDDQILEEFELFKCVESEDEMTSSINKCVNNTQTGFMEFEYMTYDGTKCEGNPTDSRAHTFKDGDQITHTDDVG